MLNKLNKCTDRNNDIIIKFSNRKSKYYVLLKLQKRIILDDTSMFIKEKKCEKTKNNEPCFLTIPC